MAEMNRQWTPSLSYDDHSDRPNSRFVDHPFSVVETASMAFASLPELRHQHGNIVTAAHERGVISSFQYETIAYAIQSLHSNAKGFFLGDSTGVGKSRVIAAVLLDAQEDARRTHCRFRGIWISASTPLKSDAESELSTVANQRIHLQNSTDIKTGTSSGASNMAFCTYTALRSSVTYNKISEWLDEGECGCVILDEAHAAKRHTTKTAMVVCDLQQRYPHMSVLYASATPASALREMGYMTRLGLWADEVEHSRMIRQFEGCSRAGLELIASTLKSMGLYVSRSLDSAGVNVQIKVTRLTPAQAGLFDKCAQKLKSRWSEGTPARPGMATCRQRALLGLITAFKVPHAIEMIASSVEAGFAVVVSVQHVGATSDYGEEPASLPGRTLLRYFEPHERAERQMLKQLVDPIDAILRHFGTDQVAELSGRRRRFDCGGEGDGGQWVKTPSTADEVNSFQTGQKKIIVVSPAGGTGVSLQAHEGQLPRRHIIVELPWTGEAFVQQCGRTHRSGQKRPPEYVILMSDTPGERRVASGMLAKLQRLGALSKGDRHAGHQQSSAMLLEQEAVDGRTLQIVMVMLFSRIAMNHTQVRERIATYTPPMRLRRERCPAVATCLEQLSSAVGLLCGHPDNWDGRRESLIDVVCSNLHKLVLHGLIPCPHKYPLAFLEHRPWSTCRAPLYTQASRERIQAVYMIARRPGNPFCTLPTALLDTIFEYSENSQWSSWGGMCPYDTVCELWSPDPRELQSARQFVRTSPHTFMSRLLSCTLQTQRAVWEVVEHSRALRAQASARARPQRTDLIRFCYPHGVPKDMAPVCIAESLAGNIVCTVSLRSTIRQWPPHPIFGQRWLHVCTVTGHRTGMRVITASADTRYAAELWMPGRSIPSVYTHAEWAHVYPNAQKVAWDPDMWARLRDTYARTRMDYETSCWKINVAIRHSLRIFMQADEKPVVIYAEPPLVQSAFIGVVTRAEQLSADAFVTGE